MSEHSMNMCSKLRWSNVARLGGTGIRACPTHAILSTLGVAIGIAAVVGVIGASTSSQAQLAKQLRALGTDMLTAQAGDDLSGVSTRLPSNTVERTCLIDGVEKTISTPTLSGVPVYRSYLVDKNATGGTITMATGQPLLDVVAGSVAKGTWLNDATAGYPTTVLGARAVQLLSVVNPGTQIWIGNTSFTVIGILDPTTLASELNNAALIGTETTKQQFDYKGEPTTVYERPAEDKVKDIRALLGLTLSPKDPTSVKVSCLSDALAAKSATDQTFTALLVGVGSITLLVSGIGVMNTIIISVLERWREIDLKRSLDAMRGHILIQFLVEALFLTFLGGTAGCVLGISVTLGMSVANGWLFTLPWCVAVAGLSVMILIGTVAGPCPAVHTSRTPPTAALNAQ